MVEVYILRVKITCRKKKVLLPRMALSRWVSPVFAQMSKEELRLYVYIIHVTVLDIMSKEASSVVFQVQIKLCIG